MFIYAVIYTPALLRKHVWLTFFFIPTSLSIILAALQRLEIRLILQSTPERMREDLGITPLRACGQGQAESIPTAGRTGFRQELHFLAELSSSLLTYTSLVEDKPPQRIQSHPRHTHKPHRISVTRASPQQDSKGHDHGEGSPHDATSHTVQEVSLKDTR